MLFPLSRRESWLALTASTISVMTRLEGGVRRLNSSGRNRSVDSVQR
jgi:hypothetical protein